MLWTVDGDAFAWQEDLGVAAMPGPDETLEQLRARQRELEASFGRPVLVLRGSTEAGIDGAPELLEIEVEIPPGSPEHALEVARQLGARRLL